MAHGPLSGATDEQTVARARRVINGYFSRIRESNVPRWEEGRKGYICTNPGIRSELLLLADIFTFLVYKNGLDVHTLDEDTLLKHVGKIIDPLIVYFKTAEDADIYEKFSRKFGEGGVIEYFDHLCSIIHAANPGFGSEEFLARLSKRNDQRVTQTHQDIIQLTQDVSDYVVQKLKDVYGTDEEESGEKAWWEQGIDSQKAKQTAYTRFQEGRKDNKKLPKEAYLDLLDYRDIVRQKQLAPFRVSI